MRIVAVVGGVLFLGLCHVAAWADEIDRPGIGEWCYAPTSAPTKLEKTAFVDAVSPAAIEAERKWGIPAPVIAAMTIVESGFGTTRLAIKSNNILAFKWPGDEIAKGRKKFVLWCQPTRDEGNVYPAFGNRAEAIDFVASRLKLSQYYAVATKAYSADLANGADRKAAGRKWLMTIAPTYNWNPTNYVPDVGRMADNPIGDGSRTLWSLEP